MNKPRKASKKTIDSIIPKQRSPLAELNRTGGTGCFRFLKPTSSSNSTSSTKSISNSTSNSRYNSNSNSNSNSSTNSSFFGQRSARPVPKSAPPKKQPNGLKQKKVSKPINPYQSIVIITPEKEKKREERSGSTPPIQASISPEIPCGSSVAPTPVCFAAGHVVTGVMDRRKCRPRGILNIGSGSEVSLDATDKTRVSTSSPLLPPLIAGASIQWLSSPSEITSGDLKPRTCSIKCQAEASVDWFLSPHEKSGNETTSQFSPVQSDSPFEKTPTHGSKFELMVHRTPSSNSSISPFSVILKRASQSSAMKLSRSDHQTVDIAASSAGIESASLAKTDKASGCRSSILTALDGSFQFRHDFTPFKNSVDLSEFANPNRVSPESDMRISWRDGLASRIFEMGEYDCCRWLSDCEDDGFEEDPFEVNSKVSSDQDAKCGFLSVEVRAQSISVEGEDDLVSPDDSDWRLFYKNQLFEL